VLIRATETIMGVGEFALADSYISRFQHAEPRPEFEIVISRREVQAGNISAALSRSNLAVDLSLSLGLDHVADLSRVNLATMRFLAGDLAGALDIGQRLRGSSTQPGIQGIASAFVGAARSSLDYDLANLQSELAALADGQQISGQAHYAGISLLNLANVDGARADFAGALAHATDAIALLELSSKGLEVPFARAAKAVALAFLGRPADARSELLEAISIPSVVGEAEILGEVGEIFGTYLDVTAGHKLLLRASEASRGDTAESEFVLVNLARSFIRVGDRSKAAKIVATLPLGNLSMEVSHLAKILVLRATLAGLEGSDTSGKLATHAYEVAAGQRADFWAKQASLINALDLPLPRLSDGIEALIGRESVWLTIIAESVCSRLGDVRPELLTAIQHEARLRSARWRHPLRTSLNQGGSTARYRAAELLDEIGEAEDIPRLRKQAKERGQPIEAKSLGRSLARRLAPRAVVHDLGRIELEIGDRQIAGTEVRRKALALLAYLMTRPDMSATKEQVLEGLWPELDLDTGENSLNQTVYFLRRIFDASFREDVSAAYVNHDGDVLRIDPELVVSDSRSCKSLIRGIRTASDPDDVRSLVELYKARFALDFLYDEWSSDYRDSLHASFLEVVERAVESDVNNGERLRAINIARTALDADPAAEQIEVSLLRLYRMTGLHAAAAEQYAHYAHVFRSDLGVEPPALETL